MNIRDRIKEFRVASSSDIVPNPKNWRQHPDDQKDAMAGILEHIGFAGAALAREVEDGKLMLIDGHLRHQIAEGGELPVLVLDVTEAEADKLLLTIDPMKEMADADAIALEDLFAKIQTSNEAVAKLFEKTADAAGLQKWAGDLDLEEEEEEDSILMPQEEGVRMVQLFLNETNIGMFHDNCSKLEDKYSTENLTDTVMEAVRNAVSSL